MRKNGQEVAEIVRERRLEGEAALHDDLDVVIEGVDLAVTRNQGPSRFDVAGKEGVCRACDALRDQREQLRDLLVDLLVFEFEVSAPVRHPAHGTRHDGRVRSPTGTAQSGSRPLITVPSPTAEWIATVPPAADSRSLKLVNPLPLRIWSTSKPSPSSRTSNTSPSGSWASENVIVEGSPPCFTAF